MIERRVAAGSVAVREDAQRAREQPAESAQGQDARAEHLLRVRVQAEGELARARSNLVRQVWLARLIATCGVVGGLAVLLTDAAFRGHLDGHIVLLNMSLFAVLLFATLAVSAYSRMVHASVEARYGATLAEVLDDFALSRQTTGLEMTQLSILERLTRRLASAPNQEQILREGLDAVFALTGAQLAAVTCASSDGSEWTTLAAPACATEQRSWQELQEKMAAAAESLGLHPDWQEKTSFRTADVARVGRGRIGDHSLQSFIAAPIVGEEQILGLTCAASLHTDAFSKQAIQALATLASSLCVALQNVQGRRALEKLNLQIIACLGAVPEGRDLWADKMPSVSGRLKC